MTTFEKRLLKKSVLDERGLDRDFSNLSLSKKLWKGGVYFLGDILVLSLSDLIYFCNLTHSEALYIERYLREVYGRNISTYSVNDSFPKSISKKDIYSILVNYQDLCAINVLDNFKFSERTLSWLYRVYKEKPLLGVSND